MNRLSFGNATSTMTPVAKAAYHNKVRQYIKKVEDGERVYVGFTSSADLRRTGSIGYIDSMCWEEREPWTSLWSKPVTPSSSEPVVYHLYIKWEGRRQTTQVWCHEIEILEDYQGPTVWRWEKPEIPLVEARDRLGREIKVGSFVNYVLHHFEHYGTSVHFGTVTKVERDGTVWAKNIQLGSDETVATKKINDNSTVVVLTKDLLDVVMLAKLASV